MGFLDRFYWFLSFSGHKDERLAFRGGFRLLGEPGMVGWLKPNVLRLSGTGEIFKTAEVMYVNGMFSSCVVLDHFPGVIFWNSTYIVLSCNSLLKGRLSWLKVKL